jgi:hypothetical protein
MKIPGGLAETERMARIATRTVGGPYDLDGFDETLYTIDGSYFLYGMGGPLSPYGQRLRANQVATGSVLMPMTEAEARSWVRQHCESTVYDATFGAPPAVAISGLPLDAVRVCLQLPAAVAEAILNKAGNQPIETWIRTLIEQTLNGKPN